MTVPGARSAALAKRLRRREQRNVTYLADDFPVFWQSARGATVTDVDGHEYVDCTAAFGVANTGHGNTHVLEAIEQQARRLVHGMGDVHPTEIRVRLLERLAQILPEQLDRVFLATTGSEAVEAALKTAMLATGKPRFAAFRGAYHGLTFGALGVAGIERFREPFAAALAGEPLLLEYPREGERAAHDAAQDARTMLGARDDVAALLVEPIQGRAGCIVPPDGYLTALRAICDDLHIVMVADEIYTGFGRTGQWFALDRERVVPDILCIGKALGSGIPISAAVGRARAMDAWPPATGEALHTSTFLGHPLACAAALATIDELESRDLPQRAARLGERLRPRLEALRTRRGVTGVRGRGLLWGVALRDAGVASRVVRRSLRSGAIFLQTGIDGNVVAISPPLVIGEDDLERAIDILTDAIGAEE